MRQIFFRAGEVIIEVVGSPDTASEGPSTLWGITYVVADIDATAAYFGDRTAPVKDAVQPGRRITTLRHQQARDLGSVRDDLGTHSRLLRRVVEPTARCFAYPRRMVAFEDRGSAFDDVVIIHTDGGCRPNPGPGGWGAVLRHRSTSARCAAATPARQATTGWN